MLTRDRGLPLPAALVLMSPWTDLNLTGSTLSVDDPIVDVGGLVEMRDWFLAGCDSRDPLASALYADLTGLPPTLVQVAGGEALRDDSTRLVSHMVAAGVDARCEEWPDLVHVWQYFAGHAPEADRALAAIGVWLRSRLAS